MYCYNPFLNFIKRSIDWHWIPRYKLRALH